MSTMTTINKAGLIDELAERVGGTKVEAEKYLLAFQDVVIDNMIEGNDVKLSGFASFVTATQAARTVKNPSTGEPIEVPEKKVPRFTPTGKLKKIIADGKREEKE